MKHLFFTLILLIISTLYARGQSAKITPVLDSLYRLTYTNYSTGIGLSYADRLIEEAKAIGNTQYENSAIQLKAGSYVNLGLFPQLQSLADSVEVNRFRAKSPATYYYVKFILSQSYNYQGKYRLAINVAQELYDDSQGYEDETLEYYEDGQVQPPLKTGNRLNALSCLGTAEYCMSHWEKSIEYYEECIAIAQKWPKQLIAELRDAYDGRMLASLKLSDNERKLRYIKEFEDFMVEYKKSANRPTDVDENYAMFEFYIYDGYVNAYTAIGDYDKAKEYAAISRYTLSTITQAYNNIAGTFYSTMAKYAMTIGDYRKAMIYADSAAYYNRDFDSSSELEALKVKLDANHMMRNFNADYDIAKRILTLSDSLTAEMKNSNIDEISTLLGMDKLKIEAQETEMRNHRYLTIAIGALLLSIAAAFSYIQLQKRRRERDMRQLLSEQNELLAQEVARQTSELRDKNEEITTQNEVLFVKNKIISESHREMTDSINYAKRIQRALLPDINDLQNGLEIEGIFTFYRPRDIVSGDFYWGRKRDDSLLLLCADCTGHGVPGAFMSLIGNTILNEISSRSEYIAPSDILCMLDAQIIDALNHGENLDVNDGMDVALINLNPNTLQLDYALARRPIYIVRDGVLQEFKGTKRSIGDRDERSCELSFEGGTIQLQKGDSIYIFSDGIADQFGGATEENPHGKRLKSCGLKTLIQDIATLPIEQQHNTFSQRFDKWIGDCPQIDDITLIGIRV